MHVSMNRCTVEHFVVHFHCNALCCVVDHNIFHPPTVISVNESSVKLSIIPPWFTKASRTLRYDMKYRKVGVSVWRLAPESRILTRTIAGLEPNTLYEFKVTVDYQGQSLTSESISLQTKATDSKTKRSIQ